ncbi:hypothetical protein ABFS82_14G029900 [Erythranthe guttata]|uniref:O-methyltransferase domain-containing protein n=1 Tax=Erythranthe guttata TaxID=4155 RepID=A0A022R1B5_ERYGU|nr:PREDICTED: (RS)-norcoclaurine 6-O-methyltransferase-like [Erythranthe guttata]EYU32600.1 hypothetical protein MIMGU_mgv1a009130mg [Erythranthe guttata]|eukprot:XP_012842897.1 PREDICTED: (RS)-norcoclaurine 6-O-methyltransferase-like [Erythranthe guttata]
MGLDEEARARAEVWNYAFGYINCRVVKCAVELEIPDIVRKHAGAGAGGPVSLSELSSAVGVPTEPLHRIMRFLIHHRIFKTSPPPPHAESSSSDEVHYAATPLSGLLTRDNLAPFMLLQGTPPGPNRGITPEALRTGRRPDLKSVNGEDTWSVPDFGYHMKVFTDSMAAHARVATQAVIDNFPEGFEGIETLLDVGGRHGMALSMLVKAFPWLRGTVLDLPKIVDHAPPLEGIHFVGGSMFENIPNSNAVMLMWILHDWSDEACIDILKKCKDAIPKDTGKVMIVEAVIDEDGEGDEYAGARLSLDMVMMSVMVKGKERTYKEWAYLLEEAGFSRHNVVNIKTVVSVIEAYP